MSRIKSNIVFGLLNFEYKYLTAEKFGNQINVTGTALRAKQMWTFEQVDNTGRKGYLKSHQGKILESNKNGNVTCITDESDEEQLFEVEISDDGKWAFKDIYGKYLAGNSDQLFTCFKMTEEAKWFVHLNIHPQCNLKSLSRKRYVYQHEEELRADEDIAWGCKSIFTLHFQKGRYALLDSNNHYLNGTTGGLTNTLVEKDCLFTLSLNESYFNFRFMNGHYLTIHGPNGKLIANKLNAGKDKMFILEESKAQVVLTASNGRKASIKQGIDVTANQTIEAEDTEIFQLGYHRGKSDKITFLARTNKYWLADDKSITASASSLSPNAVFNIHNVGNKIALKAFNNKYICSSSGGQLAPTSSTIDDNTLFTLTLINRPKIILRGMHGYVGATSSKKVQCNLGVPEALQLINTEDDGKYILKTMEGFSLKIQSDLSINTTVGDEDYFFIELHSLNKLQIKAENGQYLMGNQNGAIIAGSDESNVNTLWEY